MVPHVKDVILASADQVAIDAVAAKLMGFDPLHDVKFIRLAHERGLGCGDVRDIEIVGDLEAAEMNWHFDGPFKHMTFASRNQHRIYWGPLKKPLEWSLKTWLAPWAYVASVSYHDLFWYPFFGPRRVRAALESEWGRLFANWGRVAVDPAGRGYPRWAPPAPRSRASVSATSSRGCGWSGWRSRSRRRCRPARAGGRRRPKAPRAWPRGRPPP